MKTTAGTIIIAVMRFKDLLSGSMAEKLALIFGTRKADKEIFSDIEETLILADISLPLVERLLTDLKRKCGLGDDRKDYLACLRQDLLAILTSAGGDQPYTYPHRCILLLVGINGSGKTTTAAKLANYFARNGGNVMLAAADTFRAAGSSQLGIWGRRLGFPVIEGERGADPGSVVFNGVQSFLAKGCDWLIVDTAGRVQTKDHLMRELEKVGRVIHKAAPDIPRETFLVLDAATGQNALLQADKFREYSGLTGIVLTKCDGTAKGGTILSISDSLKIPVRFIGTGESEHDLLEFTPADYVEWLVG